MRYQWLHCIAALDIKTKQFRDNLKISRLLEKRNAGDLIIGKQEDLLPKSNDLAPETDRDLQHRH